MAAHMREIHEVMFSPSPMLPQHPFQHMQVASIKQSLRRPFKHVHATKRQLTRPPGHQPLALQRPFKLSIQPPFYWHLLPIFGFLKTLSSKLLGFFQSSNGIGRFCLLIWSTIANWHVISEKIPRFTFLRVKGPRWWTGVLASSHQRTGFSQPLALQPRMECICQPQMCLFLCLMLSTKGRGHLFKKKSSKVKQWWLKEITKTVQIFWSETPRVRSSMMTINCAKKRLVTSSLRSVAILHKSHGSGSPQDMTQKKSRPNHWPEPLTELWSIFHWM